MTESKQINVDSLKYVPHIGRVSLERLNKEGYETMLQVVAELSITEFKEITGKDRGEVAEAFAFMKEQLTEQGIIPKMDMTASDLLKLRSQYQRLHSGSRDFDMLLHSETAPDGGLEYGSITEIYGENGSGKTQMSLSLTLNMLLDQPEGLVAYIDTEGTFRPERIHEMCIARKIENVDNILDRIIVLKVHQADAQIAVISNINSMMATKTPIKMVVVDSGTALFRGGFTGRGNIKSKFDLLNDMLHKLKGIAEFWKIPIIFVNQIYHKPDELYGRDADIPYGGNIVGHLMPYRIKLSIVGSGRKHKAKIIKSPYHPNVEAVFQITPKGIENVEASN